MASQSRRQSRPAKTFDSLSPNLLLAPVFFDDERMEDLHRFIGGVHSSQLEWTLGGDVATGRIDVAFTPSTGTSTTKYMYRHKTKRSLSFQASCRV